MLLDATAPDLIRHATPPPDVAGPGDSVPFDMSVTGRDLRIVDGAYTGERDAPDGALLASFTVDAMARGFPGNAPTTDDRTAL